jgi:tetratricopeptide (TPR) repeat protein
MRRSAAIGRADRSEVALRAAYEEFSNDGRAATLVGDFRRALRRYRLARAYAHRIDDDALSDVSDVNIAMVRLQLGDAEGAEERLREILLRTSDPRVEFTAAYYLASSLRKQSRFDKALVYGKRALDRARRLGSDDFIAAGEMLLGNVLLARTYTDAALGHYREALRIQKSRPEDNRYSLAILLENIGYCLLLGGEHADGVTHIEQALALATEIGDRRCEAECYQDLCYGHLLQDDLEPAREFGALALSLACRHGYRDIEENCHYMLGEIFGRQGNDDSRDVHFQRLQELFPDVPHLRDFLCAVDVTRIITLKR